MSFDSRWSFWNDTSPMSFDYNRLLSEIHRNCVFGISWKTIDIIQSSNQNWDIKVNSSHWLQLVLPAAGRAFEEMQLNRSYYQLFILNSNSFYTEDELWNDSTKCKHSLFKWIYFQRFKWKFEPELERCSKHETVKKKSIFFFYSCLQCTVNRRREKERFPIQIRYEFQAVWRWMAQLKSIDDYFDHLAETRCKMIGPTK